MGQERKSEGVLTVNAKLSRYDLMALNYRGTTLLGEGRLVIPDAATGRARAVLPADMFAYMNFLASSVPSVSDYQSDYFDQSAPVQPLEAGGLSGINGASLELALEMAEWFKYATDVPAPGKYVVAADPLDPAYVAADAGKVWALAAPGAGTFSFGRITRLKGNTVFFLFTAIGHPH